MTARDEFIQALKEDLDVKLTPLSSLIDLFLLGETGIHQSISCLAMDEETEKRIKAFNDHSERVREIIKDFAKPIKEAIEMELVRLDDCIHSAVWRGSEATFDIMVDFFAGRTLAPYLRELADQLEQNKSVER